MKILNKNERDQIAVNTAIRNLQRAAATSFITLSDAPASYTGFGSLGPAGAAVRVNDAQTGVVFKWSTAEYIDIRDYDETLTTNSDITTAMQAALDDYSNHLTRTIRVPLVGTGTLLFDPASITWPITSNVAWTIEIACKQLTCSSVWAMPSSMTLRGVIRDNNATFLSEPNVLPLVHAAITENLCLLQLAGNTLVENIAINNQNGVAISAFGTNLITLRNVKASTSKFSDHAIEINECFWINMEHVFAQNGTGATVAAIGFLNGTHDSGTSGGGTDCGLVRCKDIRLARSGILLRADVGPVGTRNFVFEDVICENMLANLPLFEFDSSQGSAYVGDVKIIRPEIADAISAGSNYWIKNSSRDTTSTYDVIVEGRVDQYLIDPTSDPIKNFTVNQEIPSSATLDNAPSITAIHAGTENWMNWKRHSPTCLDVKLLTAPVGVPWVPGTNLGVTQDAASWTQNTSGATITTGVLGPDGSTKAATVSGGSGVRCYDAAHTLAVGDWIIGGVWMQSAASLSSRSARISLITSGFESNGTANDAIFNNYGMEDKVTSAGWRWFSCAYKVTAIGTNPCTVRFILSNNGFTCNFFNPCAVLIPVASAIDDAWALNIARSLKGGWGSGGVAGEVSLPDHQTLHAGIAGSTGGVRANRIATPTAGTKTITSTGMPVGLLLSLTGASLGTITATGSYHVVDTESSAATDDLDVIGGGVDGQTLILRAANSARTVVVKDATGNLHLTGDMLLDNEQDTISLIYVSALNAWLETSRADNGA